MSLNPHTNNARTTLLGVLIVYALTVAINLGEFWPFSIYPMFSQAGNPWSRAIIREVQPEDSLSWNALPLADVPGQSYGVRNGGVDPIDLANFVSKTAIWNQDRVAALSLMLLADPPKEPLRLMVYRVQARLTEQDSIAMTAMPYVVVGTDLPPDTKHLNPELRP